MKTNSQLTIFDLSPFLAGDYDQPGNEKHLEMNLRPYGCVGSCGHATPIAVSDNPAVQAIVPVPVECKSNLAQAAIGVL